MLVIQSVFLLIMLLTVAGLRLTSPRSVHFKWKTEKVKKILDIFKDEKREEVEYKATTRSKVVPARVQETIDLRSIANEHWNHLSDDERNEIIENEMDNWGVKPESVRRTPAPRNAAEEDYKKQLRYEKWAQKWQGFNPEAEGINISDILAQGVLKNRSDFVDFHVFK